MSGPTFSVGELIALKGIVFRLDAIVPTDNDAVKQLVFTPVGEAPAPRQKPRRAKGKKP